MTLKEKNIARRLNDLKLVAQYIYARFCQANTFTGSLCEAIIIDMKDIHKNIEQFGRIGQITVDYILSEYEESVNIKREKLESVINICNLYISRMKQVLLAAKADVSNEDDRLVVQKRDITVEKGNQFIKAIKELRADVERKLELL